MEGLWSGGGRVDCSLCSCRDTGGRQLVAFPILPSRGPSKDRRSLQDMIRKIQQLAFFFFFFNFASHKDFVSMARMESQVHST